MSIHIVFRRVTIARGAHTQKESEPHLLGRMQQVIVCDALNVIPYNLLCM